MRDRRRLRALTKLIVLWQIVWALELVIMFGYAAAGEALQCFLAAAVGGCSMTFWAQARRDRNDEMTR